MRTLQDNNKNPERKTAIVARVLSSLRIDIAGLSETRLAEEGKFDEIGGGYTFYWSGRAETEARQAGVGFAIRTDLAKSLEANPIGVSDRIITLHLKTHKETLYRENLLLLNN